VGGAGGAAAAGGAVRRTHVVGASRQGTRHTQRGAQHVRGGRGGGGTYPNSALLSNHHRSTVCLSPHTYVATV
jgi:hypothetical protein